MSQPLKGRPGAALSYCLLSLPFSSGRRCREMKHLLSGVALAVLVATAPVLAQAPMTPASPSAPAGTPAAAPPAAPTPPAATSATAAPSLGEPGNPAQKPG